MIKVRRWTLVVATLAMVGAALVLSFVLSLSTSGLLAERHFVWLFWVNVAVAALLLLVVGLGVLRLVVRLRSGKFGSRLLARLAGIFAVVGVVPGLLIYGVPMYFVAQATVWRSRWFWRDERIAQINRSWRLSYQPLAATWRLSLGGLAQSFPTLSEALAPLSRVTGWRVTELERLDPAEHYTVEFSFRLDNSQLPQPMQIDLGSDWKLGIVRNLPVAGP